MTDEQGMIRAIAACREAIEQGQSPFGAAIARDGTFLTVCTNTVKSDSNPTAHAEINAIVTACRSLDVTNLEGATLYSSCEPCPMCLAAIHWAKIDRVVYGATIQDAEQAGIPQIQLPAPELVARMASPVKLQSRVLHGECVELFNQWKQRRDAQPD